MSDQKIATEHFSPERPGVVHLWSHTPHGLRWSDEDRRFILLFLIAGDAYCAEQFTVSGADQSAAALGENFIFRSLE